MKRPTAAALATAIAVAVLLVGLDRWTEPYDRTTSHAVRGWLALGAVLAVALRFAIADRAIPWFRGALLVAVVGGWSNYYYGSRAVFLGIDDYSDVTFYYLNSKYLDELGHYDLYPAMLVADRETSDRYTSAVDQVRDLRDDVVKPVAFALARGAEVEAHFSRARWDAFRHDTDVLLSKQTLAEVRYVYVDHGYNPPPTWSVVGGVLSNAVPVESLKILALIDLALVAAAFAALGATFGVEPVLWALLWLAVTFSGRWPMLGQALLRFDWLCALIGAMCALRRERYGVAGALFGLAAASRVFPTIFFGAWLFEAIADTWRERKILRRHLNFSGSALGVISLLSLLAVARYGVGTCAEALSNLALHARSFSSHRVGLGVVATWRGEFTREDLRLAGGMAAREQVVQELQPILLGIAVSVLVALALAAWRTRRPPWETMVWLVVPLFAATNPQVNYWNLRVLAVIWHAVWLVSPPRPMAPVDRAYHAFGLVALFGTEVVVHRVFTSGSERHAVHALGSWGLAIWGVVLLGWLALVSLRGSPQAR